MLGNQAVLGNQTVLGNQAVLKNPSEQDNFVLENQTVLGNLQLSAGTVVVGSEMLHLKWRKQRIRKGKGHVYLFNTRDGVGQT